jgi:hypothetical protein
MNATQWIAATVLLLAPLLGCDRSEPAEDVAFRAAHAALVQYHGQWRQAFPAVVSLDDPRHGTEASMRQEVTDLLDARNRAADAAGKPRIDIAGDGSFTAP